VCWCAAVGYCPLKVARCGASLADQLVIGVVLEADEMNAAGREGTGVGASVPIPRYQSVLSGMLSGSISRRDVRAAVVVSNRRVEQHGWRVDP
jgi:hypothetical protein